MSNFKLSDIELRNRKTTFQTFLKRCEQEEFAKKEVEKERIAEEERLKEEEFTKKEEKVETARLKPVEETKTDEQKNEYCRIKKSDKKKIKKNRKKVNKGDLEKICNEKNICSFETVQTTSGMKKIKCVPKAPQIIVGPPEPPPQKISEEEEIENLEIEKQGKSDLVEAILNGSLLGSKDPTNEILEQNKEIYNKWDEKDEFKGYVDDHNKPKLIKSFLIKLEIIQLRNLAELITRFKEFMLNKKKITSKLEYINKDNEKSDENKIVKKDNVNVIPSPPTPKKNESNTDMIIYGEGEKSEEYKKKEREKKDLINKIEIICNFTVENIKYHPGDKYIKHKLLKKCSKNEVTRKLKKLMDGKHSDLDLDGIEYLKQEIEYLKLVLAEFLKGRTLILQNKNEQNLLEGPTNNPTILQLEHSKQELDTKIEELNNKHRLALEDVKTNDHKTLEKIKLEHKNEVDEAEQKHKNELDEAEQKHKKREQELNQELKEAKNSKQDEETTKEEIERLTKLIEQNKLIQKEIEQENKKLEDTMTENKKILKIEMKKEEEERRKKMKEFMERKGESLKEAIGKKDDKGKFTNMSEIKIEALENYSTLHKKIKNFLVFKENELIKAHHSKFYSDNINRNNEKLVETLTLFPSEPFLGIKGLPLVAAFGTTPEKEEEKKEKEINLKVVKEGVRKFIQDRADFIFDPSKHHKLSVKEYLKTL